MPKLKDIGGGVQIVDISGDQSEAIDRYEKQLGLMDLYNKVQNAPVERALKDADLKIKNNQVEQLDIANHAALVDLHVKKNEEFRKQTSFMFDQVNNVISALGQNATIGNAVLQQAFPGSILSENKDGSYTVGLNTAQGMKAMTIDPRKVSDPKTLLSTEAELRKEWIRNGDSFKEIDHNYKIIGQAKSMATGASDQAMIVAYAKMLDPQSVVRSSEGDQIKKTVNIPDWLYNAYERSIKDPNAPAFGSDINSPGRQNIAKFADEIYKSAKQSMDLLGDSYSQIAPASNLNVKNILVPIGSYNYLGQKKEPVNETPPRIPDATQPTQVQPTPQPVQPPSAQLKEKPDYGSEFDRVLIDMIGNISGGQSGK